MNVAGIRTIDGTQVPCGSDWRRFYFYHLEKADVFIPILSRWFLFSNACEDETTYAKDKNIKIIPVLASFEEFNRVMSQPDQFTNECPEIELKVPKFKSIFNRANR